MPIVINTVHAMVLILKSILKCASFHFCMLQANRDAVH
jgi:hypothetical protein